MFDREEWIKSGNYYAKIYYCDKWGGRNDKNLVIFLKVSIGGVIFSQSASCSSKLLVMMSNDASRKFFISLSICIVASRSKQENIFGGFSHYSNCSVLFISRVSVVEI